MMGIHEEPEPQIQQGRRWTNPGTQPVPGTADGRGVTCSAPRSSPEPQGSYQGCFHLDTALGGCPPTALSPSPWRLPSALLCQGKTNQILSLRLCWSLNPPMLQPWSNLCLTPHCWRTSGEPLVPSRDPLPCPGPWQRGQRGQTRSHGWAGVFPLLPPTPLALFCPLVEGSQGWAGPGPISQAEGVQCPAFPWPRALPSLHLAGRARSNVASFGTDSKHFIRCGICEHEAGV